MSVIHKFKHSISLLTAAMLITASLLVGLTSSRQDNNSAFAEQINEDIEQKQVDDPSHKKIDSETLLEAESKTSDQSPSDEGIRVILELDDSASSSKIRQLKNLGADIESRNDDLVQAVIPPDAIEEIANLDFTNFIRQPQYPVPSTVSEAVSIISSDDLNFRGNTGEGVKVAVIDIGFDVSNPEISSNIVEAVSFRSDADIETSDPSHGTAVAEIIVDVAPDVELYLYNVDTDLSLLNAIDYIIDQGQVDVISMSLGWLNVGPYDGSSPISQAVDSAQNNGILFVVSAGNFAKSHWEGQFSDSDSDSWQNFSTSDETIDMQASAGEIVEVYLSWNDNWASSTQDFDLFVLDRFGDPIADSQDFQDGAGSHPTESLAFVAPYSGTFYILIAKYDAITNPTFDLFVYPNVLSEHRVASGSIAIPADASGALTVGAINWQNLELEGFSSQGPTSDGRIKPDISGPDGVTTTAISSFYGTSAAAPYVAGAAALVIANSTASIDADELQLFLEENTRDNHVKNNEDGTGVVSLSFLLPPNNSPIAIAGPDRSVNEGSVVTLDGSGSYDDDIGDTLSYSWVQSSGPAISISSSSSAQPTFTAPYVSSSTPVAFTLEVTDGLETTSDTVNISINDNSDSLTVTGSAKGELKKAAGGFSKGKHKIGIEISAEYIAESGSVTIQPGSSIGTLSIDGNNYDLVITSLTASKKNIKFSASPEGISGSVSGTLAFKKALNFEDVKDAKANGSNTIKVKIGDATFKISKPAGKLSFG